MLEILRVLIVWFILLAISCEDLEKDTVIKRLIISVVVVFAYNIVKGGI